MSSPFQSPLFTPTPEHQMLRSTLREFVKKEVEPQASIHDQKEIFNLSLFRKLGRLGLLGITCDQKYGGAGMDAVSAVIAGEELSASDPGFCLAWLAHSILCAHNINTNAASPEQKKMWLPKLCSGEWIGAMAMSEAEAGTDVLSINTQYSVNQNEEFILNGKKMWVTNGVIDQDSTLADCVLVYARTQERSISTFVVEKTFKGFKPGQKIRNKTGMRASNTSELLFQNVRIPKTHILGSPGQSLVHMMRNIEIERLSLAAMSLGIAGRALQIMNRYSGERKSFGHPIRHFGQIKQHLADSYAEYMACKTFVYHIAGSLNLKKAKQRLNSDATKLVCAKMAKNTADRAIQVLGGYGYVEEYVVERLWRDSKLLEIGGGTNEALQKNITKELENHTQF